MPLRNPLNKDKYTESEWAEMEALQRYYTQDIHTELHEFFQMTEENDKVPRFGATATDMERTMFQSRLGTGLLCMEAENILVNILQYQTSRLSRDSWRNGYLNDPRNLLCEVLKHFVVETLSHAEVNPDLQILIEKWSTFIHHIAMTGIFHAGKYSETMEAMLVSVRNSFRYHVMPSLSKHISTSCAREHLHWFIQSAKRVLGHGTQFLYYVLRDSDQTPKNCTIPNIQVGHMPLGRVLRSNSGRLLQAMVLSLPFQQVFPLGYVPGGLSTTTEQLLRAKTSGFDADEEGNVAPPRILLQILRQEKIDKIQASGKKRSQEPLAEIDPATFLRGPNSGIARPFWEKQELIDEFIKLHELFIKVASLIELLEQAYALAGEGGDLLVYGVTRKHVAGLVVDYTLLSNSIRDSIYIIEQHADGLYQHLVRRNPKPSNPILHWKRNYMQVSSISMLLSDDLDKCHDAAYRVRQQATSYTLTLNQRMERLRGNLNSFVSETNDFSRDLRSVLKLKGSIEADQLLEAEMPRCNLLDSCFTIHFADDLDEEDVVPLAAIKGVSLPPGRMSRSLLKKEKDPVIVDRSASVAEIPTMWITGISPGVHPLSGAQTKVSGTGFVDGLNIRVGNERIKGAYIQIDGQRKVISFLSPPSSSAGQKSVQVTNPDGSSCSSFIIYAAMEDENDA